MTRSYLGAIILAISLYGCGSSVVDDPESERVPKAYRVLDAPSLLVFEQEGYALVHDGDSITDSIALLYTESLLPYGKYDMIARDARTLELQVPNEHDSLKAIADGFVYHSDFEKRLSVDSGSISGVEQVVVFPSRELPFEIGRGRMARPHWYGEVLTELEVWHVQLGL